MQPSPHIVIVGGGPAGLMAAETLAEAGMPVHLYEALPTVGRKFLRAGVGGLNLTHSEPLEQFISRYSQPQHLEPMLRTFGPREMIQWANGLGFKTFTGTSGRVFPVGMKASPLLRAWLQRLTASGVVMHVNHKWINLIASAAQERQPRPTTLTFETLEGSQNIHADAVLLALGGGSWPKLGSTGGYLLTGCMSTGRWAAQGILEFLCKSAGGARTPAQR